MYKLVAVVFYFLSLISLYLTLFGTSNSDQFFFGLILSVFFALEGQIMDVRDRIEMFSREKRKNESSP